MANEIPGREEDEGAVADDGGTGAGGVDEVVDNGAGGEGADGGGDPGGEGVDNGAGADGAAAAPAEPPYVKELRDRVEKAEKALEARAGDQPQPRPAGPTDPGPEFYSQMEKDFGFTKIKDENGGDAISMQPGQFVKGLVQFGRDLMRMSREYSDGLVHANTSEIRTDALISDLADKTPDMGRYRSEIKAYLNEFYEAKDRSNPKFIMAGYWYAKGKAGPAAAGAAPQNNRRNVRVLGAPPAPANRGGAKPGGKPLGSIANSLIRGGTFKDAKEFSAWQNADLNKL